MKWMDSTGLKISLFVLSKTVCLMNACSMWVFVENNLTKINQPSAYLYFIIMDKWTQKCIQKNPVKHLRWSNFQKYLEAFSC